jgi:hypothetical protein
LTEVPLDYQSGDEIRQVAIMGDRHYSGLRASDGADISSRAKHKAYMKRTGLTTADDFKETWHKAEKQRIDEKHGIDPSRKYDVAQAIEKLRDKRR